MCVVGALACVELECYGEAVEWCDQGLGVSAMGEQWSGVTRGLSLFPLPSSKIEPENTKLRELRAKATRERVR